MSIIEVLGMALVGVGLVLGFYRLWRGATTPDRVVAADTLSVITTAGLAWVAAVLDNPIYLDVALIYGALAFVGVVAIARALESGGRS